MKVNLPALQQQKRGNTGPWNALDAQVPGEYYRHQGMGDWPDFTNTLAKKEDKAKKQRLKGLANQDGHSLSKGADEIITRIETNMQRGRVSALVMNVFPNTVI